MAIPVLTPFPSPGNGSLASAFAGPYGGQEWPGQDAAPLIALPGLGLRSPVVHRRLLALLIAVALSLVALWTRYESGQERQLSERIAAVRQAMDQTKRLADALTPAVQGDAQALINLATSADGLAKSISGLQPKGAEFGFSALPDHLQAALEQTLSIAEQANQSANTIVDQQELLVQAAAALTHLADQCEALQELTKEVALMTQSQALSGTSGTESKALADLSSLVLQIDSGLKKLLTPEGSIAEQGVELTQDIESLDQLALWVLYGNKERGLNATVERATRGKLVDMIFIVEGLRSQARAVLRQHASLTAVQQAQLEVNERIEALTAHLEALKGGLLAEIHQRATHTAWLLAPLLLAVLGGLEWVVLEMRVRQLHIRGAKAAHQDEQSRLGRAEAEVPSAAAPNASGRQLELRLMDDSESSSHFSGMLEVPALAEVAAAVAQSMHQRAEEIRCLSVGLQNSVAGLTQHLVIQHTDVPTSFAMSLQTQSVLQQRNALAVEIARRIHGISSQARQLALLACQSLQAAQSGIFGLQRLSAGINPATHQAKDLKHRVQRRVERRKSGDTPAPVPTQA
jgi:hypothetical protein